MSDKTIGLYGKKEIFWCLLTPVLEGLLFGLMVKGIVNFNSVKVLRIELEPFIFGKLFGIESALPVGVMPARSADSNITFGLAHNRYFNSSVEPF